MKKHKENTQNTNQEGITRKEAIKKMGNSSRYIFNFKSKESAS